MWDDCIHQLWFEQVSYDVALQRDKEQRIHRHNGSEKAYGERICRKFSHQRGRKRNERLPHQKDRVKPDHSVSRVTRKREKMVMVQPEFANNDEADKPTQKFRNKIDKSMVEFADASAIVQNRYLQFKNQQGHDNREDTVAERLCPVQPQFALPKALEKPHHISPEVAPRKADPIC